MSEAFWKASEELNLKGLTKSDATLGSANWKPSTENYVVRVSVDVGFIGGWGTGFGYVPRDDRGKLMATGVRQVEGCSSVTWLEMMAMRIEMTNDCQFLKVTRKSNSWCIIQKYQE